MDYQQLTTMLQRQGIDARSLTPLMPSTEMSVYRLSVDGAAAMTSWRTLRASVDDTGYWPILLGGDEDLEEYADGSSRGRDETPESLIQAGLRINAEAWMREHLAAHGHEPERGPWPDGVEPADSFTIPYDMQTWEPLPTVHVALLPTRQGWQVPAFLRYGGWNECPSPEEHVCMMKHWAETYGAEPLGMARDRVEMAVAHPPRERAAALTLAVEQYAYCSDIVDQGTETLDALAASLLGATAWFFWWD